MFTALIAAAAFFADVQTVEIRYEERDLIEPARVEVLQTQIRRAARDVCEVRRARTLTEHRVAQACVAEAETRANDQLRRAVARAGVIEVASN